MGGVTKQYSEEARQPFVKADDMRNKRRVLLTDWPQSLTVQQYDWLPLLSQEAV